MKIRLHQVVLSKNSAWFEAQFGAIDAKRQNGNAQNLDYEFIFAPNTGPGTLSLILIASVGVCILELPGSSDIYYRKSQSR